MTPLVTYVLAGYRKNYQMTLNSLLSQTMKEGEILFINTDPERNGKLAKELAHIPIVRVFDCDWHNSLNLGAREAHSDVIMWASDDDIYFPFRSAIIYEYLQDSDICMGSLVSVADGTIKYGSLGYGGFRKSKMIEKDIWVRDEYKTAKDSPFILEALYKRCKFSVCRVPTGYYMPGGSCETRKGDLDDDVRKALGFLAPELAMKYGDLSKSKGDPMHIWIDGIHEKEHSFRDWR